jgi:Tfp pilus assembly protein PilN
MRAVNLLPADLRGAAQKPASPARDAEPAQGIGAYVVLGVLALAVAAFAGYVLTNNTIKQRQADLEASQQRATAATAKAAALRPYADFESLANARVETVRGLAAARFDWERALQDLSLATPENVKLQALNGDMGLPGATVTGGDPLRGSISAPAITMTGCAPTQTDVARMMARVRAVQGVTRVALSKSEKPTASAVTGGSTESPCGKGTPPSFSMVVFFERSAALAALAPAEANAAAQTVPVPNAVNEAAPEGTAEGGAEGADGAAGTDPAAAGAGETAAADSAATTTTTSTTGSTP